MNYPTYGSTGVAAGNTLAGAGKNAAPYTNLEPAAPPQPRFEAVADHLANLPTMAARAVDRLRSLGDRYGGSIPEPISKAEARGVPNSLSARFEQSTTDLDLLLGQIHAQLDRLERF